MLPSSPLLLKGGVKSFFTVRPAPLVAPSPPPTVLLYVVAPLLAQSQVVWSTSSITPSLSFTVPLQYVQRESLVGEEGDTKQRMGVGCTDLGGGALRG